LENETIPYPYTRVFQVNGAWFWQQIDSYGDASGELVGPFPNAVAAGHAARKVIVAKHASREGA
jgi:hypothetical protein